MGEKHQFIIPALIFAVVVSIVGGFLVVQAQTAWLRPTSAGEPTLQSPGDARINGGVTIGSGATMGAAGTLTTTGGAILNTGGASTGLIVQSGNLSMPGGNIYLGGSVLNTSGRSLMASEFLNSDTNGGQVWTNDVLTIDDATAGGGWYWAGTQSITLPSPALGFRLRGSSDDGGLCQVWVDNMFAANITNVGWTSAYDLNGFFPAGGWFLGSNAGGMNTTNNTFLFKYLQPGQHLNLVSANDTRCDIYGNCTICITYDGYGKCIERGPGVGNCTTNSCGTTADNWGYIKPIGLNIIPAGRTVYLRGGRNNGGGVQYIRCYLDILYANEYKPW